MVLRHSWRNLGVTKHSSDLVLLVCRSNPDQIINKLHLKWCLCLKDQVDQLSSIFWVGSSCKNLFRESMVDYWSLTVSSERMFLHFSLTLETGCVNWLLSIGLNHKYRQSLVKSHSDTRLIAFERIILSQHNFDDFVLWVNLTWQNKLLHSLFHG